MSNFLTMIMVLGGTFIAGAALLYLSLMTGRQGPPQQRRDKPLETTAVMARLRRRRMPAPRSAANERRGLCENVG